MFKFIVLLLFSLTVAAHSEKLKSVELPVDFLANAGKIPEQQGIISDIVGTVTGIVKSTTGKNSFSSTSSSQLLICILSKVSSTISFVKSPEIIVYSTF